MSATEKILVLIKLLAIEAFARPANIAKRGVPAVVPKTLPDPQNVFTPRASVSQKRPSRSFFDYRQGFGTRARGMSSRYGKALIPPAFFV